MRSITVTGTNYGRPGISVTFDEGGLHGDPFVVEHVQSRVKIGWTVEAGGPVVGKARLSLDDPLMTRATIASVFDEVDDVILVGVELDEAPLPPGTCA